MKTVTRFWFVLVLAFTTIFSFHSSVSGEQSASHIIPVNHSHLVDQLGSISGQVTNQNGEPLADIHVILYASDYWIESTPAAISDANGHYKIEFLPTGSYRLQFQDPLDIYALQFYTSAATYYGAAEIPILANQVENINVTMQPGGRFRGTVTFGAEPFTAWGNVAVHIKTGMYWDYVTGTAISQTTGTFETGALLPGNYRLCADGYIPGTGYPLSSCDYDANGLDLPSYDLGITETKEITIDMDNGQFDGEISGRVTGNGKAVKGLEVRLYDAGHDNTTPRLTVYTDMESQYAFTDLGYGNFYLEAADPTGIYATVFYTNPDGNPALIFGGSHATNEINLDLPLAATLRGAVYHPTSEPFADVKIFVEQRYQNPSSVGGIQWRLLTQRPSTEPDGHFAIRGLVAGSYRLHFIDCQNATICDPYSSSGDPDLRMRTSIELTVTSGQTISDLKIVLGSALFLPVVMK